MAVKSYAGKITSNLEQLSPGQYAEMSDLWWEHEAELIIRRIRKNPAEYQEAIYNKFVENFSQTGEFMFEI